MPLLPLVTINNKRDEDFLRRKTANFDFSKFKRGELKDLVQNMRRTMKEAHGVGLSANQIGYNFRMFVAEYDNKFYAIFNPKITKFSKETAEMEEGCLSVPKKYGLVKRSFRVTLSGFNVEGRKIKIRARGFLARIFQHETDHLSGKLFIDRTLNVYDSPMPAEPQQDTEND